MATYTPSSVTVSQFPNFYGGKQDLFIEASQKAVHRGIDFIRKADGNYQRVFFDLLNIFERTRGDIARASGTKPAEEFGRRRDTHGQSTCYYTYLDQQYLPYGDKLKKILGTYLPSLMNGKKPVAGDPDCQVRFRTFDIPNAQLAAAYMRSLKPVEATPDAKGDDTQSDRITAYRERLLALKETHPDRYQLISDYTDALAYRRESEMQFDIFSIPPDLCRFVTAEVFWRRGDRLVPATSYTCLYDSTLTPEDAVEALKENPVAISDSLVQKKPCVLVKHMDREHIQDILQEIAAIFERCVTRKNPDAETLKADLSEMIYRFSFAMPEERGSGAIVEWLEATVAGFHGFRVCRPPESMLYFDAVTVPYLPNFQKKYPALEPIVN